MDFHPLCISVLQRARARNQRDVQEWQKLGKVIPIGSDEFQVSTLVKSGRCYYNGFLLKDQKTIESSALATFSISVEKKNMKSCCCCSTSEEGGKLSSSSPCELPFARLFMSQYSLVEQSAASPRLLLRGSRRGCKGVNLKVPSNLQQCCLQRSLCSIWRQGKATTSQSGQQLFKDAFLRQWLLPCQHPKNQCFWERPSSSAGCYCGGGKSSFMVEQ